MDKLTRQAENEKFREWWLKEGYKQVPKNRITLDSMATTITYWAWKAWEERASQPSAMYSDGDIIARRDVEREIYKQCDEEDIAEMNRR